MEPVELSAKDDNITNCEIDTPLIDKSEQDEAGLASIFSSAANICNNNLGAGILGLPFAISESGWFLGVILFIIFGIQSAFSYHLLMAVGRTYKISSWWIVCNNVIPKFKELVDISVVVSSFGSCCAYLIIIGSNMSSVAKYFNLSSNFNNSFTETRYFWIILFMIILIIPTTLLRKLDSLKFSSVMGVLCFICLIFIMILYYFVDNLELNVTSLNIHMFPSDGFWAFFQAAPVYVFAFGGHKLAFILTNELYNNTLNRINKTVISSFSFVTIIYITAGLCGYFSFGDKSNANILQNYPLNDIYIMIIRICLSIAIAFSFAVVSNPMKHSMASLLFKCNDASILIWYKFYFIVFVLVSVTFIVAMLTQDLGIIFKLIGSTSGTVLQIILPGLLYYYHHCSEFEKNPFHKIKKKLAMLTIIFGCIMMPISVTLVFV